MPEDKKEEEEEEEKGWRKITLPENLVAEIEELMNSRHEKRPVRVPLGIFIGDLIRASLERERVFQSYPSPLETYAVEPDCVYVRDNKRDVIAELRFKDETDLYCNIDAAKNCVHIGFAWSIPAVQMLLESRRKGKEKNGKKDPSTL